MPETILTRNRDSDDSDPHFPKKRSLESTSKWLAIEHPIGSAFSDATWAFEAWAFPRWGTDHPSHPYGSSSLRNLAVPAQLVDFLRCTFWLGCPRLRDKFPASPNSGWNTTKEEKAKGFWADWGKSAWQCKTMIFFQYHLFSSFLSITTPWIFICNLSRAVFSALAYSCSRVGADDSRCLFRQLMFFSKPSSMLILSLIPCGRFCLLLCCGGVTSLKLWKDLHPLPLSGLAHLSLPPQPCLSDYADLMSKEKKATTASQWTLLLQLPASASARTCGKQNNVPLLPLKKFMSQFPGTMNRWPYKQKGLCKCELYRILRWEDDLGLSGGV